MACNLRAIGCLTYSVKKNRLLRGNYKAQAGSISLFVELADHALAAVRLVTRTSGCASLIICSAERGTSKNYIVRATSGMLGDGLVGNILFHRHIAHANEDQVGY